MSCGSDFASFDTQMIIVPYPTLDSRETDSRWSPRLKHVSGFQQRDQIDFFRSTLGLFLRTRRSLLCAAAGIPHLQKVERRETTQCMTKSEDS